MSNSTSTASERFLADGHVVLTGFLPPQELRELEQQLDRYIAEIVPTLPDTDAFFHERGKPETLKQLQHMAGDPFFADFPRRARWQEMAETLLGEPVIGQGCEWFNKPPGCDHPTPPHQDNYYFCLEPPNVVTFWLALDVINQENGCLRVVPGSHRRGIRPHARTQVLGFSQGITDYNDQDRRQEHAVVLQPGDLSAHHGELIHRADPNHSARPRRAFAIVYRGESCQRNPQAYERYQQQVRAQHSAMGLDDG